MTFLADETVHLMHLILDTNQYWASCITKMALIPHVTSIYVSLGHGEPLEHLGIPVLRRRLQSVFSQKFSEFQFYLLQTLLHRKMIAQIL